MLILKSLFRKSHYFEKWLVELLIQTHRFFIFAFMFVKHMLLQKALPVPVEYQGLYLVPSVSNVPATKSLYTNENSIFPWPLAGRSFWMDYGYGTNY